MFWQDHESPENDEESGAHSRSSFTDIQIHIENPRYQEGTYYTECVLMNKISLLIFRLLTHSLRKSTSNESTAHATLLHTSPDVYISAFLLHSSLVLCSNIVLLSTACCIY